MAWPEQCTDKSNVKSQKIISEIFLNVDLSVRKAFKANVSNEHSNLDHLLWMHFCHLNEWIHSLANRFYRNVNLNKPNENLNASTQNVEF